MLLFSLLVFAGSSDAALLRCSNWSWPVITDAPVTDETSGILVTWDLLTPDEVCTDPPTKPNFNERRLSDVSVIAKCDQCPKCTVRLPQRYELPLGTSINTIYLLTKQIPHHKIYTDIDVHYVVVGSMPKSLRNCEIITKEKPKDDELFTTGNVVLFILVFFSVIFCVCGARCCFSKIA